MNIGRWTIILAPGQSKLCLFHYAVDLDILAKLYNGICNVILFNNIQLILFSLTDEQDHKHEAISLDESLPDDDLAPEKSTDMGDSEEVGFLYILHLCQFLETSERKKNCDFLYLLKRICKRIFQIHLRPNS